MGKFPPWSDLPQELLSAIAECLRSNPIDIHRFRSVCKSWSSSSPSISLPKLFYPLPLTICTPPYPFRNHSYFSSPEIPHSILSVTVVYAIRPPIADDYPSCMPSFILFVDQSNPEKVSIRKPFSQFSYSLPVNFPRNFNLLSFHASELGRFYNLSRPLNRDANLDRLSEFVFSGLIRKVVLFSIDNLFFVVGLADDGKLGLLRLGLGDKNENLGGQLQWEIIHDAKGYRFDDIVDFRGRMLGIDRRGRVYKLEIGSSSPVMISVIAPPIAGGGGRRKRLVESLGRLHLVVRSNIREETDAMFKVYELNENTKKWVVVKSLGDRTFFFGLDFSFSASADELRGSCGKNWVLFKERSFLNYSRYDDDSDLFRNLKSKDLHVGVWRLEDAAHLGVIGSHPELAKVLWPPPTWIWPNELSERIRSLLSILGYLQVKIPDYEKLEAKLDEFSLQQQICALIIIKSGIQMKGTLNQARETDKMLKQVEAVAMSWLEHCNSTILTNLQRTFTLGNEESYGCVSSFKILRSAFKQSNSDFDLLSMEMKLHSTVLRLEEYTSEMQDAVNSSKFSSSIDELMAQRLIDHHDNEL